VILAQESQCGDLGRLSARLPRRVYFLMDQDLVPTLIRAFERLFKKKQRQDLPEMNPRDRVIRRQLLSLTNNRNACEKRLSADLPPAGLCTCGCLLILKNVGHYLPVLSAFIARRLAAAAVIETLFHDVGPAPGLKMTVAYT